MSTPLTALPPEILSCVVATIVLRPSLCNLARCSRQLHLCTIPHLYHHVTIEEEIWRGEPRNGQLRDFASSLIRTTHLAELVRHFTYVARLSEEYDEEFEWAEEIEEPEEPEGFSSPTLFKIDPDPAVKTAINAWSLSTEEANDWLSKLSHTYKCHHDAILALLLPVLLKVEKVVLDLEVKSDKHYLERMIGRAARRESPFDIQPPFEMLTAFIHSHPMFSSRRIDAIASLLRLPAIQEISGGFGKTVVADHGQFRVMDTTLIDLDSSSSPVISLDLAAHSLSTVDLGHIFRAPKALKTLFYKVYPLACIKFPDIRHELEPQRNCLESLGFDYDEIHATFYGMGNFSEEGPMTSFISFNNLKLFKTAALFLTKTENRAQRHNFINFFPPSLETLHLTRFQTRFESLLEAIEHLLGQKSSQQMPALKKIILEESEPLGRRSEVGTPVKLRKLLWKGTEENAMGRLSRVAAAHGVSVDVIEAPPDYWHLTDDWSD